MSNQSKNIKVEYFSDHGILLPSKGATKGPEQKSCLIQNDTQLMYRINHCPQLFSNYYRSENLR